MHRDRRGKAARTRYVEWVALAQHDLWDRWIVVPGHPGREPEFGDAVAVGFAYIDHYAGTSLWVFVLATPGDLRPFLRPMEDQGRILRFRYGPGWPEARHLTEEERAALGLPKKPEKIDIYGRPHLDGLRQNRTLDHLRAPGYPDDLQVHFDGETMWCRIERIRSDGSRRSRTGHDPLGV